MTTYEKLRNIRRFIVNKAAEVFTYTNWGSDFAAKQMIDIPKAERGQCDNVDISELTATEMEELGFGKMTKDSKSYLIPLWILPFLPENIKTNCIDGSIVLEKSEMDTDNRYGCLAYSVFPRNP